jgi:catechol 2,3-dioxygenase-like lactoylglutathione lyase family enzyme
LAQFNHTIVVSRDKHASAQFLVDILGLPPPRAWGHFVAVDLANGVTLDYVETKDPFPMQHLAFLVSDDEFDAAFARIKERGLEFHADPTGKSPGAINHNFGGRGVYWFDPNGHGLEMITVPYGGWPAQTPEQT